MQSKGWLANQKRSPKNNSGFSVFGLCSRLNFFSRHDLAAEVNALFQNVIHATGVHTVRRSDVMLKLSLPVGNPDIHRVVEGEAIGLRLFGGAFVIQVPTFLFESKAGKIDSTSTVRDSPQGLVRDAPQCFQACGGNGSQSRHSSGFFHYGDSIPPRLNIPRKVESGLNQTLEIVAFPLFHTKNRIFPAIPMGYVGLQSI